MGLGLCVSSRDLFLISTTRANRKSMLTYSGARLQRGILWTHRSPYHQCNLGVPGRRYRIVSVGMDVLASLETELEETDWANICLKFSIWALSSNDD